MAEESFGHTTIHVNEPSIASQSWVAARRTSGSTWMEKKGVTVGVKRLEGMMSVFGSHLGGGEKM